MTRTVRNLSVLCLGDIMASNDQKEWNLLHMSELIVVLRKSLQETRNLPGWDGEDRVWCACGRALRYLYTQDLPYNKEDPILQATVKHMAQYLLLEESGGIGLQA